MITHWNGFIAYFIFNNETNNHSHESMLIDGPVVPGIAVPDGVGMIVVVHIQGSHGVRPAGLARDICESGDG